jgi:hypothetical protein
VLEFFSFFRLNNIPEYIHTSFSFAHTLISGHLSCFCLLAILINAGVNLGYKSLFETLLCILLDMGPGAELLDPG